MSALARNDVATDAPLKIALVTTFYPPHNFGGDGIYVRRLAHSLAKLGCDVTVLYDTDAYNTLAPPERRNPAPLDEPANVRVEALSSALGSLSPLLTQQFGAPVANRAQIEEVLSRDFDVIHFHNVSLVGGPAILSMGKPAVRLYTAHEHWLVCPTHILWRNKRELCTGRQCFSCQAAYRRPPQLWRSTGALEAHAPSVDAFIALSESSAENHRNFGFKHPMRVMPSFIPDEEAPANEDAPNEGRPYLLFAGRLEAIKGLQDVIPLFDASMPADLLIAGDGEYEPELRRLAIGAPRVRFLGRLPTEELGRLYRHALALIAPSLCYEVFPLVALEAFRSGTPIIARNLGSYPEIVNRSGAGLLFSTQQDIRDAIVRLASEPNLRSAMSRAARAAYVANWSERVSLASYFELVAELAERKQLPRTAESAQRLHQMITATPV